MNYKLLVKKLFFLLINLTNYVFISLTPISHNFSRIWQIIYSQRYCRKFSCNNCQFTRPINYIVGEKYFRIDDNTKFGQMVVLTAWDKYATKTYSPSVQIGKNCCFGDFLHLTCINKILIGNDVLTGRWVTITDNSHGITSEKDLHLPPSKRLLYSKGPVIIGDNVWIGDKVTILPGVQIGEGCVIGANTVVAQDIQPYSVVYGSPIRITKKS